MHQKTEHKEREGRKTMFRNLHKKPIINIIIFVYKLLKSILCPADAEEGELAACPDHNVFQVKQFHMRHSTNNNFIRDILAHCEYTF